MRILISAIAMAVSIKLSAAVPRVDVVLPDLLMAYKPYLYLNDKGDVTGILVDIVDCAFADASVSYRPLPSKRAMFEVMTNLADFVVPVVQEESRFSDMKNKPVASTLIHEAFISFVVNRNQAHLLQSNKITYPVKIGFSLGSMSKRYSQRYQNFENIIAKSNNHQLKQLITGRIDIATIVAIWDGEDYQQFEGRPLFGKTIDILEAGGYFSYKFSFENPLLVNRFNQRISDCDVNFQAERTNPYRQDTDSK